MRKNFLIITTSLATSFAYAADGGITVERSGEKNGFISPLECVEHHLEFIPIDLDKENNKTIFPDLNIKLFRKTNPSKFIRYEESKVRISYHGDIQGCKDWGRMSNYLSNDGKNYVVFKNFDGCILNSGFDSKPDDNIPNLQFVYNISYRNESGKRTDGGKSPYIYFEYKDGLVGPQEELADNRTRIWEPPTGTPPIISGNICADYQIVKCRSSQGTCDQFDKAVRKSKVFGTVFE